MKVARRVALGYGIIILLSAILLIAQVSAFRSLKEVSRKNAGDNLVVALTIVDLLRDRDAIQEASQRYFTLREPGSAEEMKEAVQRFEDALRQIREYKGSVREAEEVKRLHQFWLDFKEILARELGVQAMPPAGTVTNSLTEQLDTLRAQSMTVYHAMLQDIRKQAEDSRDSSERVELIVWWIGTATLLLGFLLAFLTVRSVSIPLRLLCEGTRGIAEGKSFYRLDTSRNDEISQIAKDFNTLAEKLRGGTASTEGESERQL